MKSIYTKTGDTGTTAIREGVRVYKDDPRIEANGQTDHLNSLLGIVRSLLPAESEAAVMIRDIQRELMVVMSHVVSFSVIHPPPRKSQSAQFLRPNTHAYIRLSRCRCAILPNSQARRRRYTPE